MIQKPKVIFLNGPSSAGKTTLSHALQEQLAVPFLHIGIDKIIGMMPHKHNDWVTSYEKISSKNPDYRKEGFWFEKNENNGTIEQTLKMGPLGEKIALLHLDIAELMLQKNYNLIIDEVVLDLQLFRLWQERLKPYQTTFIGLTCKKEILEQRERNRGNRMIGSAVQQSNVIHINKEYNLILETSNKKSDELAWIIINHLIDKSFFK